MQQHLVQPLADTKADDAADDVAGRWAYLITTDDDPKGLNQLLHSSHLMTRCIRLFVLGRLRRRFPWMIRFPWKPGTFGHRAASDYDDGWAPKFGRTYCAGHCPATNDAGKSP